MPGRPALVAAVLVAALVFTGCASENGTRVWEAKRSSASESGPTQRGELSGADAASSATASASPRASASPARSVAPAAEAGGLCRRLNYGMVAAAVGVRFEIAAASGTSGSEQACVLQRIGVAAPDLTLAVIPEALAEEEPADGDTEAATVTSPAEAFRADFQPAGANAVTALGNAGYSQVTAAESGSGPRVEVGWLADDTVYLLSFTATRSTSPAAARKVLPGLVGLARQLAK
jgi:hypothetical protein